MESQMSPATPRLLWDSAQVSLIRVMPNIKPYDYTSGGPKWATWTCNTSQWPPKEESGKQLLPKENYSNFPISNLFFHPICPLLSSSVTTVLKLTSFRNIFSLWSLCFADTYSLASSASYHQLCFLPSSVPQVPADLGYGFSPLSSGFQQTSVIPLDLCLSPASRLIKDLINEFMWM